MIALDEFRKRAQNVKDNFLKRANGNELTEMIDDVIATDKSCNELRSQIETCRAVRNRKSEEIGRLISTGDKEGASKISKEVSELKEELTRLEGEYSGVNDKLRFLITGLPNLLDATVPFGRDSNDNPVVREWGTPRQFAFDPKDHKALGEGLDILDLERGTKITGAGFPAYKGAGALLERALINFMLELHTTKHGYTEMWLPFIVNRDTMFGTGQLPKFENDLFWAENGKYGLIPTAEVPLTNYYRNEILKEDDLPLYLTAYSPCFRQEAGQHGEETRGLIRVHQFNKVEMVKISHPDTSYYELEKMVENAEKVLQLLGLPYRVITLCSGDTGFCAAKTYDLEVWLPSQNKYREISSCSNCTDFQARRMNLRFKSKVTGKNHFVHTLNGSGIAVGRTWVAIMENYQQEDGSLLIPKILQPYMYGLEKIVNY